MDTKKIWHRVACTSVGLYRMGRDAVASFFDRAYVAGQPQSTATEDVAYESDGGDVPENTDGE